MKERLAQIAITENLRKKIIKMKKEKTYDVFIGELLERKS